jgi:Ca2+-binding RTX toxin-like protein
MLKSLVASAFALGVLTWMPAASAQIIPGECTFDGESAVMVFASDDPITLVRDGDAILANGVGCEGATVANTDVIRLFTDSITIDLAGGPLAPGATDEGDGSSEIELELEADILLLLGTGGPDHIVFGRDSEIVCTDAGASFGANLNADESTPDVDIRDCNASIVSHGISSVAGRGGDDVLSAAGEGMDEPWQIGLTMLGGTGDDVLTSGRSDDVLRGQQGFDTLDVSWTDLFTWIFAGTQSASEPHAGVANFAVGTDIGEDDIFGFERFITSDFGNQLYGSQRPEEFIAGDGDDEIWPKGGDDDIFGGAGHDAVSFADAPRGIQLDLRDGDASGHGSDQIWGIEDVQATAFRDSVMGNGAGNLIDLLEGNDQASGLGGADSIDGGTGDDVIDGGSAADTVTSSWGDDVVRGGPGDDHLFGVSGDDVIDGGSGEDYIVGAGGVDILNGSWDDDFVAGGYRADAVSGGPGKLDRCLTDRLDTVSGCELSGLPD